MNKNKDLVDISMASLELSILAFKKGFKCYGWSAFMYESIWNDDNTYTLEDINYTIPEKYWTSEFRIAPHCLIQKWLREKHNIIVWIAPLEVSSSNANGFRYTWVIHKQNDINFQKFDNTLIGFLKYELAFEKGLYEGLKLI